MAAAISLNSQKNSSSGRFMCKRKVESSSLLQTEKTKKPKIMQVRDDMLSPEKALRVAMLKSRYAELIFKFTHNKDMISRDKYEKERLEAKKRVEKERAVAEYKVLEAVSRKKAQNESRLQRERAREAARMALESMERTVKIDDSLAELRNLEKMCSGFVLGRNPLERLGLFIKVDDYSEEYEDRFLNAEEGEIID